MANNSAKKNEVSIRTTVIVLSYLVYGLMAWLLLFNAYFLYEGTVSLIHCLLCVAIAALNHFCLNQVIKCWELQLPPGAADYYYDILAMNLLVSCLDPYTHYVWHVYWMILAFGLYQLGKWLWAYITPKYEEPDQQTEEEAKKSKKDKEKKERVKYVKH